MCTKWYDMVVIIFHDRVDLGTSQSGGGSRHVSIGGGGGDLGTPQSGGGAFTMKP